MLQKYFQTKKVAEKFGKRLIKERVRNLLIIGAGVSVDTYKAIPTGLGPTEKMNDILEKPLRTISCAFAGNSDSKVSIELSIIYDHVDLFKDKTRRR